MMQQAFAANDIRVLQATLPVGIVAEVDLPWDFLSEVEQRHADRFRIAARRQAFVFARAMLRTALSELMGLPPREIPLTVNATGKPCMEPGTARSCIRFNISHGPSTVVVVICQQDEVGVDVEDLSRPIRIPLLVRNYFSAAEQAEFSDYSEDSRVSAFFRAWTRKEAAWKLHGSESCTPWASIQVSLADALHTRVRLSGSTKETSQVLPCITWQPSSETVASIVLPSTGSTWPRCYFQTIDLFSKRLQLI